MEASVIVDRVRKVLKDSDGTRWSDASLLDYLTLAELEIVRARPWANKDEVTVQLEKGKVRHEILPTGTISLLRVERNMGQDGSTPGDMITQMDKEQLDNSNKDWVEDGGEVIEGWAKDSDDDKTFYTYPRAHPTNGVYVEIIVSKIPDTLTALGDDLTIPDEFALPLQQFTQGFALMEDDPGADFPRGAGFLQQAYISLGVNIPQEEEG